MLPPDWTITPARRGDAEAIAEVYLASRADALPYLPRLHSDDEVRDWIAAILLPGCRVWVARTQEELIGFAALNGELLEQLYVRPGRLRQGVGSALLALAKRHSPRRLQLHVFQRNRPARAFYAAHGFRLVEERDGSTNEEGEPDLLLEWRPARDSRGL